MKKRLWWLALLVLIWLLVSSCGLTDDFSTVRDLGNSFMTALRDGDHAASYNMLAPALQQEIGDMNAWVAFAAPRNFSDWSFSSTSVDNGEGQMDGEATFTDGEYNIALVFGKYGDDWKLTGINFMKK